MSEDIVFSQSFSAVSIAIQHPEFLYFSDVTNAKFQVKFLKFTVQQCDVVTFCHELKSESADGKKYTRLRYERIQEIENSDLANMLNTMW